MTSGLARKKEGEKKRNRKQWEWNDDYSDEKEKKGWKKIARRLDSQHAFLFSILFSKREPMMKMVMITMIGIPRSYIFMYVLMQKYSYKKEMNCEFGTNQEYMRILLMTMMMLMITFFSQSFFTIFTL